VDFLGARLVSAASRMAEAEVRIMSPLPMAETPRAMVCLLSRVLGWRRWAREREMPVSIYIGDQMINFHRPGDFVGSVKRFTLAKSGPPQNPPWGGGPCASCGEGTGLR